MTSMNTQIVYVVVSDDTDTYLEQTMVSVYSLRMHNPEAKVVLFTDRQTDSTLSGSRAGILDYISEKRVIEIPDRYSKLQRSRYLKTTVRQNIRGDFLYVDSDTLIMKDLSDIDALTMDIGAAYNMWRPRSHSIPRWVCNYYLMLGLDLAYVKKCDFNGGVIFVRDTPVSYRLYGEWHKAWLESIGIGINRDQPALVKANRACGDVIRQLPYTWNLQIMPTYAKNYRNNAYIVHYYGSSNDIASSANIPRELREQFAYVGQNQSKLPLLITSKEEELLRSRIALLLFRNHRRMFNIFDRISTLLLKFKGELLD